MDVEMTPAPTCTCPSGDGSLRSPCPAHGALPAINLQHEPLGFVLFPLSPAAVAPHVAEYIIGFDFDEVRDVYGERFAVFWQGLVAMFVGQPSAQAAFATTGKQQDGEVQGDALIDAALGYLSTALDDLDSCPDRRPGIMVTEAMHALREAIAARQPAAQTYSIDADPAGIRARVADVITGPLMVGAQGHTPPPAGHWAGPLWQMARADAAAQGIDLGQLRALAEQWKQLEYPFSYEGNQAQRATDACRADLLALIDQSDVAPGVGS